MDERTVLIFHDQPITDEQQMDFRFNFVELEVSDAKSNLTPAEERRFVDGVKDLSNLDQDNRLLKRSDHQRMCGLGNLR